MRRTKKRRFHSRRTLDHRCPAREIVSDVRRRLEVQLAVEVAVIANRVAFIGDAFDQIRPALRVSSENEKGRLHPASAKRVENRRCRVGIGPVVEGERNSAAARRELANRAAEERTVTMEGAVRRAAEENGRGAEGEDHTPTATFPRTL